jgi:hypothetical protein
MKILVIHFAQWYYFLSHSPVHADPVLAAAAVAVAPAVAEHT